VRGPELILGGILVPLLSLACDHWVRLTWQRRRAKCMIGQTMAYLHSADPENRSRQDVNSKLTMLAADFAHKTMMDGLIPSPPNADLVAYDTLPREQGERSVCNRPMSTRMARLPLLL